MSNDAAHRTIITERDAAETVGEVLARVREERRLHLSSASIKTKIPLWFLQAVEAGDHERIADDVYGRIWFKSYCTYLGLDAGRAYAAFQNERRWFGEHLEKRRTARHPKAAVSAAGTMDMPRMIRAGLVAAAVLGVAVYAGMAFMRTVTPPEITLSTPTDGFITTQRTIVIEGRTDQEVALLINGKSVPIDSNGNFRDSLDLQEGLNTVTVVGSKKHGKEMTITRRVVVEPTERPTAFEALPDTAGM